MATMPHPWRERPRLARGARDAFWIATLGVISLYVFFLALGGFGVGDAVAATVAVGMLMVLWTLHAVRAAREHPGEPDSRLAHDRERRGF